MPIYSVEQSCRNVLLSRHYVFIVSVCGELKELLSVSPRGFAIYPFYREVIIEVDYI